MLKLSLLIAGILVVCLLFLSVNILLRGGQFRSQHIGQSRAMRDRGITFVQSMDAIERKKDPHRVTAMEHGHKTNN